MFEERYTFLNYKLNVFGLLFGSFPMGNVAPANAMTEAWYISLLFNSVLTSEDQQISIFTFFLAIFKHSPHYVLTLFPKYLSHFIFLSTQ